MSDTIQYQNHNLKIIVNKKLKYTYIHIDKNKNILVKTPQKSKAFVYSLLQKKESWINKQLEKIDNLQIVKNIEIHSQEYIQDRVDYFSKVMNLKFNKLKFRKMKNRWGSCSSNKEITLNKSLFCVDKNLIDYVVVHELAHLVYMNHSNYFHSLVEKYLPNSKLLSKSLRNIRITS